MLLVSSKAKKGLDPLVFGVSQRGLMGFFAFVGDDVGVYLGLLQHLQAVG